MKATGNTIATWESQYKEVSLFLQGIENVIRDNLRQQETLNTFKSAFIRLHKSTELDYGQKPRQRISYPTTCATKPLTKEGPAFLARIVIFGQTGYSSNIRKYARGSYSRTEMGATFFLAMLCERMWLAAYMEKVKRILLSCIPPFMNYHNSFPTTEKYN